ncbi:MAG TPA: hypothetical protein VM888_13850, partial [Chitinophagaceae bacterium]|nr:hypothetical protein [Chitinophagaceae bacterium]
MLLVLYTSAQTTEKKKVSNAAFTFAADRYGISDLSKTGDVHPTNYIRQGRVFGDVIIRYTHNRKLDTLKASDQSNTTVLQDGKTINTWSVEGQGNKALQLTQSFSLNNTALTWDIILENKSANLVRVEDLIVPLFYNSGGGENPKEIFEERVVKHHFISGNNSFLFFQRPTGLGPYLVMVPL